MHTKLEHSAIAEKIIRYTDSLHQYLTSETGELEAGDELWALLDQTSLRKELQAALEYFGLPTSICTSQTDWLLFSDNVAAVIEDCPLLMPAKKLNTRFVESISVTRIPIDPAEGIGMHWNIKFHTNPVAAFAVLPNESRATRAAVIVRHLAGS